MSILVKFGIWAVPLGVVLAFLPLLYQTEFESTDFDYVQETCNRTLGSYKLQCPNISSDLKELFKSHGVVVLRSVLPPELIEDLIGEVQCRFRPKEKSRSWALFARNVWMDSEVFGRFALHQDSPLGCLAAQLIPGAHTIRYGHEELNMLVEEQNGTEAWQTDLESNLPENLTGSVPLVRFFLPLIRQNLSNVTGGSESVFPLNHFARLRKYYPPCFDEDGRLKGTCLAMNNLAAAPALAPGDLLLYSPLMPHRTQRMLSGSRIGLSGSLYEPSLLIPWVAEVKSLELLTEPPDMGLVCWDKSTKEWHGNLNWQSAGTHGISNGTTACFPQVYPQPQACASSCPSAIPLETSTQVHSRTLLSPSPPSRITLVAFWLAGLALSLATWSTSRNLPPRQYVAQTCFSWATFLTSLLWVGLFANEVVGAMQLLGIIMGLKPMAEGITLLAWGNCVDNVFGLLGLAKAGEYRVAITGIYAGPMFNVLFGNGSILLMSAMLNGGRTAFIMTPCAFVLLGSLEVVLLGTLLYSKLSGWRMTRVLGIFLGVAYFVILILGFTIEHFITRASSDQSDGLMSVWL